MNPKIGIPVKKYKRRKNIKIKYKGICTDIA